MNLNSEQKTSDNNNTSATLEYAKTVQNTPAMAQYLEIKSEHADYLLFYRMGDFYELFFEDAITAAGALGLALTSRSKIGDKEIPMCGVPFHAYEIYLSRLIKMGYKVAICEQMENPEDAKKRGYKAIVRREVVRLVTSGTLTEESLLNAKRNNFIACVHTKAQQCAIAWLDISTGEFYTEQLITLKTLPQVAISNALSRLHPSEVIFSDKLLEKPDYYSLFSEYRDELSILSQSLFNLESAKNTLLKRYEVFALDAFGNFSQEELIAAGVLLDYVNNTQKDHLPRLEFPKRILAENIMEIDAATRRSLEILDAITPGGTSLFDVLDRTVTGFGARLLAERLSSPVMDIKEINDRLDMVSFFIDNPDVRRALRKTLHQCQDLERALQRLCIGRGGPKDLYDLSATLKLIPEIKNEILSFANFQPDSVYAQPPQSLTKLVNSFFDHSALQYDIESTLLEDKTQLPALARNGGFVREGAYGDLDYLKSLRESNKEKCVELCNQYMQETGITGLKIKNNNIIGYFLEVPSKSADKILNNPKFIHRQSVLNAVRFTTQELSELENEVNSSEEKALEMEQKIFDEMVEHVIAQANPIKRSAETMAALDVATSLADLATENDYVRPIIDESLDFEIIEGRHPVVEAALKREGNGSFVANNCILSPKTDRLWLITGPNMAGKSTFLRQNALIAIMAQMGSFVPAQKAKIGLINKIFSRVGASDDLARGRSTFMVEMVETAAILNCADERSFVILDEIGRGTATFDGLSIAWAVAEQLYNINRCRTLFATHYHELTSLQQQLKAMTLHCMKIKEFNGDVIFMHEVIEGAADRSYGIHVAKLAGLPKLTIERSKQVLDLLEKSKTNKTINNINDDLPLFENLKEKVKTEEPLYSPVLEELKILDIDNLSPREALEKLYELKNKALQ